MIEKIQWLGHASFRIRGKAKIIYIDPRNLKGKPAFADIILIGHAHHDHFSAPDVEKIKTNNTVIVTPPDVAAQLKGYIHPIKPGETVKVDDVTIEGVPAYNLNKPFHPKSNGWVGFIITIDDEKLYYSSDTDLIPEMSALKNIDVALLAIGGKYTMNATEAARAASIIKPKIAVPCHYGEIVGSSSDAERFVSLCSGEARILKIAD